MSLPDYPLAFWLVAIPAILVTGIAKGGFPAGAGGIAVPLMSLFIAPPAAAGIMLPILCAMDLFGVHAYWKKWSREHLRVLIPAGIVGIALGGLAFGTLSVSGTRLIIGVIAVTFALNQMLRITERLAARLAARRRPPGAVAGSFWSALSGFTSTLAHAGGPPFSIYMLPQKLDRTVLVATSVLFFLVVNYVKLVPYAMLGQLAPGNLVTSLMFAPLAPIGIWIGVWLHRRIPERAFYAINYGLMLLVGIKLIYDALS